MADKILTFLAGAFYHFGIIKAIQDKHDCEFYTIVDVDDKPRKFFENQKLVNFQKIWYYRDHVLLEKNNKPDLDYLAHFEKKYNIKLWNVAYADKKFYKYNRFYKFSYDEILSIMEQTCKFYEGVLEDSKPNFLLMGLFDSYRNHLLYEICKAKGIKILMLGSTRFGYRGKITNDEKKFGLNGHLKEISMEGKNQSINELRGYLNKFDHSKLQKQMKVKHSKESKQKRFSTIAKFFLKGGTSTSKKHYSRYGLSRTKLIRKSFQFFKNKKAISTLMNKKFIQKIDNKNPFVYFPLHSEPERALSIAAPFYTNQIEVITHIAKSLPVGYRLYVKDHPSMSLKGGSGREITFYQDLLKLPNVVLLHPTFSRDEILEKCSLVITINGTAGFEAAFYGKPSITLVETDYSSLPSVYTLKSLNELPHAIRTSLKKTVNTEDLNKYVKMVNANSFEYDKTILNSDFYNRFFDRSYVIMEKEIESDEMKLFLRDHDSIYQKLALEFIKNIKEYKQFEKIKN